MGLAQIPRAPLDARSAFEKTLGMSWDESAEDLQYFLDRAFAPIEQRYPSLMERILNRDPEAIQIAQKSAASAEAIRLLNQRNQLLQAMQTLAMQAAAVENVEAEKRLAQRRRYVEFLELDAKREHLENQIVEERATRATRLESRQLKELAKLQRLRAELLPPPALPKPKNKTERSEVSEHRRRLRSKAEADQKLITDCLQTARTIFEAPDTEPGEKVLRIRATLETYKQDPDALPRDISEFLRNVEEDSDV